MHNQLTILIAELVGSPDTLLTVGTMDGIDESETLRLDRVGALILGVAQQAGWHAGPQSEDDERDQVAQSHGSSASFVKHRSRASSNRVIGSIGLDESASLTGGGEVIQEDEEENRSGDMDEGVSTVGPSHQVGVVEEPVLDWSLNEDAQSLLNVNKLQSMLSGNINSSLYKGEGCEGSTKLVDLQKEKKESETKPLQKRDVGIEGQWRVCMGPLGSKHHITQMEGECDYQRMSGRRSHLPSRSKPNTRLQRGKETFVADG